MRCLIYGVNFKLFEKYSHLFLSLKYFQISDFLLVTSSIIKTEVIVFSNGTY